MRSHNSLGRDQEDSVRATIFGVSINTLSCDKLRIREKVSDLTPEIDKALSPTGYSGRNMKKEADILIITNILNDVEYTSARDKPLKRETFLWSIF